MHIGVICAASRYAVTRIIPKFLADKKAGGKIPSESNSTANGAESCVTTTYAGSDARASGRPADLHIILSGALSVGLPPGGAPTTRLSLRAPRRRATCVRTRVYVGVCMGRLFRFLKDGAPRW